MKFDDSVLSLSRGIISLSLDPKRACSASRLRSTLIEFSLLNCFLAIVLEAFGVYSRFIPFLEESDSSASNFLECLAVGVVVEQRIVQVLNRLCRFPGFIRRSEL